MDDKEIAASLQATAKLIAMAIPNRAFCLFVFPSKEGEQFHYVANCQAEQVRGAMAELIRRGQMNLPDKEKN